MVSRGTMSMGGEGGGILGHSWPGRRSPPPAVAVGSQGFTLYSLFSLFTNLACSSAHLLICSHAPSELGT